jgi:hypothetical protein
MIEISLRNRLFKRNAKVFTITYPLTLFNLSQEDSEEMIFEKVKNVIQGLIFTGFPEEDFSEEKIRNIVNPPVKIP